jgi:chromate transport protein ChrA
VKLFFLPFIDIIFMFFMIRSHTRDLQLDKKTVNLILPFVVLALIIINYLYMFSALQNFDPMRVSQILCIIQIILFFIGPPIIAIVNYCCRHN